ncbi:MAG: hypothetical protein ACI9K5_002219, partial [Gammaproteobacteria bacterium]
SLLNETGARQSGPRLTDSVQGIHPEKVVSLRAE